VPQYFPSRSEGGRDYAPSPMVFHKNPINDQQPMRRGKRLAKIMWKPNKNRDGRHPLIDADPDHNPYANTQTDDNAATAPAPATPNWEVSQERVQHLGEDIRRHKKGISKSRTRERKKVPRIISPTSNPVKGAGADLDAARVMVDPDGFQIHVGPQPHYKERFSTSNGFHSIAIANTRTQTNTAKHISSRVTPLVSPMEDQTTRHQFFSNLGGPQQKQKEQQHQQETNNLQSFDNFHHQDGLDDSTVGTSLSRRHLLRDRANAFLKYASSVEQKHHKSSKERASSSYSASSPVSMLVRSKNKVKSFTKGFGKTRRSEKIEKLMHQTMGNDNVLKHGTNAESVNLNVDVGRNGKGMSPIQQHKIQLSQAVDLDLDRGKKDLIRVEGQRQGSTRQESSKVTRLVGQYTLSHESMRLDEAYHAEKVDRSLSTDSSKISHMTRHSSRISDIDNLGNDRTPITNSKRIIKMDRHTSHDEMSPLVMNRQVSDQSPVSAAKSCRPNRVTPAGGRKLLPSIELASANRASEQANSTNLVDATSSDPAALVEHQKLNKSGKSNPLPTQKHHQTPTKDTMSSRGGMFLDNSWQASPIQPAGSFAIFDDSLTEETEEIVTNSSTSISMTQQDLVISKGHQSRDQSEFIRVVAAIVIQTFFRRHLAYSLTWQRYSAVLKIQRFMHDAMDRRHAKRVALNQSTHQFYDLAAAQIQAAWRGFWVRDCINVESYCACTIQKALRSYWDRMAYIFDLYRIIIAQSAVRRLLTKNRLRKQLDAATLIQGIWRTCSAKDKFMNTVADILIVQSVCRRSLVKKRMDNLRSKRSKFQRSQPVTNRRNIMKNAPVSHSERTLKTGMARRGVAPKILHQRRNPGLNQLNSGDLIRKWKARRKGSTEMAEF